MSHTCLCCVFQKKRVMVISTNPWFCKFGLSRSCWPHLHAGRHLLLALRAVTFSTDENTLIGLWFFFFFPLPHKLSGHLKKWAHFNLILHVQLSGELFSAPVVAACNYSAPFKKRKVTALYFMQITGDLSEQLVFRRSNRKKWEAQWMVMWIWKSTGEVGKYVKITKILTFNHLGRNISIKSHVILVEVKSAVPN